MTTNTTPVPCPRCNHFDRTIRHSCRLSRSLADFREALLDELTGGWEDECFADMQAEMAVERHYEDAGWMEADRDRDEEQRRGVIDFATAWDLADPSRTAPCARHGAPKVHDRCWECDAEAEIAYRDAHEYDRIPV